MPLPCKENRSYDTPDSVAWKGHPSGGQTTAEQAEGQAGPAACRLDGETDHAWAVSFIVTDIPANETDIVGLEAWFRSRVSIEERFREAKLGAGLNHLPSADHTVNTVWAWAGALAGALNVMLATLTGAQPYVRHPSRVHIDVLRRNLLTVPARLIRHARGITLRPGPRGQYLAHALHRLRNLPAPVY